MNSQQPTFDTPNGLHQQASEPAAPHPNNRGHDKEHSRRKLDPAAKEMICRYVARGHTLKAAARLVGFSEQALHACKRRDPLFKLQLSERKEQVAENCLDALEKAVVAEGNWRAGLHYMRLVYPERFHYKPDTLTRKQHDEWTEIVFGLFEDVATPEQMRELHKRLQSITKKPA